MRRNPINEKRTKQLLTFLASKKFLSNLRPRRDADGMIPISTFPEIGRYSGHPSIGLSVHTELQRVFAQEPPETSDTADRNRGQPPQSKKRASDLKHFIASIAGMDPTQTGKYTSWIAKIWGRGDIILREDEEKVTALLTSFEESRRRLEKKDINKYASYAELARAVRNADPTRRQRLKKRALAGKTLIHDDGKIRSYSITTYEAAEEFRKPLTEWCIQYPDQFKDYAERGALVYYAKLTPGSAYKGVSPVTGLLYEEPYALLHKEDLSPYDISVPGQPIEGGIEIRDIDDDPISEVIRTELIDHARKYTPHALCSHSDLPNRECETCQDMICPSGSFQCSIDDCEGSYCGECAGMVPGVVAGGGLDRCTHCKELACSHHLVSCECGAVSCENCLGGCEACSGPRCPACSQSCDSCSIDVCWSCVETCDECEASVCKECSNRCTACYSTLCAGCTKTCVDCDEKKCESHIEECDGPCGEEICTDCSVSCQIPGCNNTALCNACHEMCPECDEPTCADHMVKDTASPLFGHKAGPDLCKKCIEDLTMKESDV